MKQVLLGILSVGAASCLFAAIQEDAELQMIRKQLADVELRVAPLEHASGVDRSPRSGGSGADATNPVRSMVVGGVQTAKDSPMDPDAADDLQDDIDALQRTVNVHLDQAEGAHGYYHGGSYYGGGHSGAERRIISQRDIAGRYASQLAIKKQRLDTMQHAANKTTQVIHGHDGETIITLWTLSDMSSKLADIEIGDVITWTGKRMDASEKSESWHVETIDKIEDRYGK